jgi:hypothetical protein
VRSDVYFDRLAKGEGTIEVDADDLYEWRSYFEFKKVIESKLDAALQEGQIEDGILFSTVGGPDPKDEVPVECANNNLALAA